MFRSSVLENIFRDDLILWIMVFQIKALDLTERCLIYGHFHLGSQRTQIVTFKMKVQGSLHNVSKYFALIITLYFSIKTKFFKIKIDRMLAPEAHFANEKMNSVNLYACH